MAARLSAGALVVAAFIGGLQLVTGQCTDAQANCIGAIVDQAPFATPSSTETCGLSQFGTEVYSFGGLQNNDNIPRQNNLVCDAADPANAHNVTSLNDLDRTTWWQAPHNFRTAELRLDWANGFWLDATSIEHRSVRPQRSILEYSIDNGQTFTIYNYYARRCPSPVNGFPSIREVTITTLPNDTSAICYEQQSGTDPEDRGMVTFIPDDRIGNRRFTDQALIESYLYITNLRYTPSSLFTLSETPLDARDTDEARRYYYAIYDWVVNGTCHCFGHSNQCVQASGDTNGLMSGCVCSHNTMGANCEQCLPLFNNRTWTPGTETEANACQDCGCNNHATSCTFNAALGRGTCVACQDNTVGNNCDRCAPNFFINGAVAITDPNVCLPCLCSVAGSVAGTECNGDATGQCDCKANTINRQCNECADGFFNISITNLDGCDPCLCDAAGSTSLTCMKDSTGACPCKANVEGRTCDVCQDGFFNLDAGNALGCTPCDCDCGGSTSPVCDKTSGQCLCKPFITERQCTRPVMRYYFPDFDWLRLEAESFQTPAPAAQVVRMENPFPVGTFSGQGIVQYPAGTHSSVLNTTTQPQLPTEYSRLLCLPGATSVSVTTGNPLVLLDVTGPATLDSCVVYPETGQTCPVSLANILLVANCVDHRASQLTTCENTFDAQCEALTFSIMLDIWDTALPCECNSVGSFNDTCKMYGGQCFCQPGVQGRKCDECVPGFFGITSTGCQPCVCNAMGSTDNLCDLTTGQCSCLPNIGQRDCSQCMPNFFDFGNPAGCQACNCNPSFSMDLQCNNTGVCTCLPGVGGDKCTQCLPGFHTLTAGVGCTPCACNPAGTLTGRTCEAFNGTCPCKDNAMGMNCDQCRPGTFGLSLDAPDGCFECVCSGKSTTCTSASGYRLDTVVEAFDQGTSSFFLFNAPGGATLGRDVDAAGDSLLLLNYFGGDEGIFFDAGDTRLLGDLSGSLGHRLTYFISGSHVDLGGVLTPPITGVIGSVIIGTDLPGVGNLVAALPSIGIDTLTEVSIPLYTGSVWRVGSHTGPVATLQDIRAVLQRVTRFAIRATGYYDVTTVLGFHTTSLFNLTLERAVVSSDPSLRVVTSVENCVCPPEYMGLSCERCQTPTHTRNFDIRSIAAATPVNAFDTCTLCSCNSHSATCSEVLGLCVACQDNTEGDHCELCDDRFFGDATASINGCQPCLCNATGSQNNICNKVNGQCDCQPNIVNRQCTDCRNTTYEFSSSGCMSCGCNVNATTTSTCIGNDCICTQDVGQCTCQPNVIGRTCTQCEFGTFGVAPDCIVCHECFLQWFAIIDRLTLLVEFQDNRTTEALQRAFGGLSASSITATLDTIRDKLDQSEVRLAGRQDVQLEAELVLLEEMYRTVLSSFVSASVDIDAVEANLNFSISRLPYIESFNGSVVVFNGSIITAAQLDMLSSQQNELTQNVTATATEENNLLQIVAANASGAVASAQASQASVAISANTAQDVLANAIPNVESVHPQYRALYQINENDIAALNATVARLEVYSLNATGIINRAYQVVRVANQTADLARMEAMSRLNEATQLAADVRSLAVLANATYESAANGSRAASAVQAAAMAAYQRARLNLDALSALNASVQTITEHLRQTAAAVAALQALQTPTVDDVVLVRNLSEQINASIVPQADIDRVLSDARSALMQAEGLLDIARIAYNISRTAYDMVVFIQTTVAQIGPISVDVNAYIARARVYIQQANSTLQQSEQVLVTIEGLTDELTLIVTTEARPLLEQAQVCLMEVLDSLQTTYSVASRLCNVQGPIAETDVIDAESRASSVNMQAQQQYAEVQAASQAAANATAEADGLRADLDGGPNASELSALLTEYIQLRMDIQMSQTRAANLTSSLEVIITDFQFISTRCG